MSIRWSVAGTARVHRLRSRKRLPGAAFRSTVFAAARSVPIKAVRRRSQLPPSQCAKVQSLARPSLRRRITTTLEGCMKRQMIFGTMLSAALAVGVAAQQPPASPGQPPSTPSTSSSQSQSDSAKTVTMTGCLQAASGSGGGAAAPGGAGAGAGASSASKSYILASASPAGAAGASKEPGAPAGAPGAAGTSGTGSTYRLTGGDDKDLEKNVGQRVEVTGRLSGRGMGSSSGAGAPGAGAGASGSSPSGPSLQVSSIRATGESCK